MSRQNELAGTVSIVTGAAGGIGSATVRTLLELGSTVIAADLPGTDFRKLRASGSAPDRLDVLDNTATREATRAAMVDLAVDDLLEVLSGQPARTPVPGTTAVPR